MKVAIVKGSPLTEKYYSILTENGIEITHVENNADAIVEGSKGATVMLFNISQFPEEVIKGLDSSVKCLIKTSIGYERVDVAAASARGIMVCNCPDYSTQEVAVFTMGLMINCVRKIHIYYDKVRQSDWDRNYDFGYPVRRLSCLTLGLMGFGNIARLVSTYAKGFGMEVIAYDPYVPDELFEKYGVKKVTTDELYAAADIVSYHMPLFESTRHILNRESLAKMKDGVIIINTARGGLIDEGALCKAIESSKLRAVGVDVVETEPLKKDHPFLKYPNCIVTPHTALQSEDAMEDRRRLSTGAAIAAAKGEVPYSCVNRKELGLVK